jgi:hypothetical protein
MADESGLWYTAENDAAAEAIRFSIDRQQSFSVNVQKTLVKPRAIEIAAISLYGYEFEYLGICRRGRRSATGQITLNVTHLKGLRDASFEAVFEALPRSVARRFDPDVEGIQRVSPKLWEEILRAIGSIPGNQNLLGSLQELVVQSTAPSPVKQNDLEIFERDAIGCAVQTWAGSGLRKRVLRSASARKDGDTPYFISRLENAPMREDLQIIHDSFNFPGMENVRADVVGTVTLSNAGESLTIINCNRMPLEQILGVDLIYYSHKFDSFVLVQYKRMTADSRARSDDLLDEDVVEDNEDSELGYRPASDPNHAKEMELIGETVKILGQISLDGDRSVHTYRMDDRPFYLKLCPQRAFHAIDDEMVKGMYVPFDLWTRLLKSEDVKGKRGGVRITWRNCTRRFSNTEFTSLLANGWIGSAEGQSRYLGEVIESVLASGKMLILAGTSGPQATRDYRRDSWGRFTDQDDPFGSY